MLEKIIKSLRKFSAEIRLGLALSLSTLPSLTLADTHYVSTTGNHIAPYTNQVDAATNIQAAIDAADNGDTIQLSDETHKGLGNRDINLYDLDLTITSESGDPENCIIDCDNLGASPALRTGRYILM